MMTEDRILELIEAYGADPMRWPVDERAAAQTLLAASDDPRLRTSLAAAKDLDTLLSTATVPAISPDARYRLYAEAAAPTAPSAWLRRLFDWPGPIWQPTGALAAALVLGIWVGIANPEASADIAGLAGGTVQTEVESGDDFDSLVGMEDNL